MLADVEASRRAESGILERQGLDGGSESFPNPQCWDEWERLISSVGGINRQEEQI